MLASYVSDDWSEARWRYKPARLGGVRSRNLSYLENVLLKGIRDGQGVFRVFSSD